MSTKGLPFRGFLVAFLYGVVSISITFFNRAVFSIWKFNYSNTLTLGQMLFSLVFLVFLKTFRLVSYADFDLKTARMMAPLVISFILMVVTGLAALQFINVPLYSALRRVTTFVVMVTEWYLLQKETPRLEAQSIYLMVLGALIASFGDLQFNLIGYILVAINCIVTAVYLVYIPKKAAETRLDTMGLIFYNNFLSFPLLFVIVYLTEWEEVVKYPDWNQTGFLVCFFTSVAQAFLLNYLIFLCSTLNSPLATSVTGGIKNIVQTLIGLVIFGDVEFSPLLIGGLVVSTIASVWYSYLKYVQVMANQKKPSEV
eukprot:TRINITY_DN3063_c0_g3_i3.p1 TRINITY_DN3063_c0_g3~~TRINITY_DN3063_c0_g3_i3.p1  ORF type:complete len:313 (+),score=67.15 TRINITY_DN3063_c0_g3_i3:331-1269(+)